LSAIDSGYLTSILGDKLKRVTKKTFGKADVQTEAQENHNLAAFNLTKKYYSYNFENIHVLHMDTSGTSINWDTTSEQYDFILEDLRKANANPGISWILVCMYRAMYGSISSSAPSKILSASLRDIYHPIFQQNNVHIVMQGYFKNYQRMHCLGYNDSAPDQPLVVHTDTAPDYFLDVGAKGFGDGVIFVNVGTGGTGHESIDSPVSYSGYNNSRDYGVLVPAFDNTSLDAIGHKVSVRFFDINNTMMDQFTISHLI
jgi:hypothetical protein